MPYTGDVRSFIAFAVVVMAIIAAGYRALMRRYHPDVNSSADAVANAKDINEAYGRSNLPHASAA